MCESCIGDNLIFPLGQILLMPERMIMEELYAHCEFEDAVTEMLKSLVISYPLCGRAGDSISEAS